MKWKKFIEEFNPSWFSSVMGTGILAIDSYYYREYLPILKRFSYIFFYLAVVFFVILFLPWILRWFFFFKRAYKDLEHPILSSFYSTFSVGILILSIGEIVIIKNYPVGEILWIIGASVTAIFVFTSFFIMFKGAQMTLNHISPAWFIPLTGLLAVPISGSFLLKYSSLYTRDYIDLLSYFSWGTGFFLYLALFAICMYRFMLHPPLPGILSPTIWINLGPIGTGVTSIIYLAKYSQFITIREPFYIFAFLFWGLGFWWVVMALFMTIYYLHKIKVPYSVSWWGYTFPLGAYISASYNMGNTVKFWTVKNVGFALYWLLVFFWIATSVNTILNIYRGTLFENQEMP